MSSAQTEADLNWGEGLDPAGVRVDSLELPTLIGDGADDELTPVGNAYTLARDDSPLDAGGVSQHGARFVFQDAAPWSAEIKAFLGEGRVPA